MADRHESLELEDMDLDQEQASISQFELKKTKKDKKKDKKKKHRHRDFDEENPPHPEAEEKKLPRRTHREEKVRESVRSVVETDLRPKKHMTRDGLQRQNSDAPVQGTVVGSTSVGSHNLLIGNQSEEPPEEEKKDGSGDDEEADLTDEEQIANI